jgi:uncharacterized protein YpuA (DUF1002 family)
MRDFFFHNFIPGKTKRPKILGLTASPIKQKIEKERITEDDIENMLQNLSNNLYSRYVTVSEDKVKELENNLSMEVKKFNSDFNQNLDALKHIEE